MAANGQELQGKLVLVTGAGTGIGHGIARVLAEQGADVALHYSNSAQGVDRGLICLRRARPPIGSKRLDGQPHPCSSTSTPPTLPWSTATHTSWPPAGVPKRSCCSSASIQHVSGRLSNLTF